MILERPKLILERPYIILERPKQKINY